MTSLTQEEREALAKWVEGKRLVAEVIGPLYNGGWNSAIEYLAKCLREAGGSEAWKK